MPHIYQLRGWLLNLTAPSQKIQKANDRHTATIFTSIVLVMMAMVAALIVLELAYCPS